MSVTQISWSPSNPVDAIFIGLLIKGRFTPWTMKSDHGWCVCTMYVFVVTQCMHKSRLYESLQLPKCHVHVVNIFIFTYLGRVWTLTKLEPSPSLWYSHGGLTFKNIIREWSLYSLIRNFFCCSLNMSLNSLKIMKKSLITEYNDSGWKLMINVMQVVMENSNI